MTRSLRQLWLAVVTHGGQLFLLLIGFRVHTRTVWIAVLVAISAISFFAWMAAYRRARAVADTATSKVASAAQGYVELMGLASAPPGYPLKSRLTLTACVWYRYEIARKGSDNKWVTEESGESHETFDLSDETGTCHVDPEGAEIQTSHNRAWTDGDYRYTEGLLLERERMYVLGQFSTIGGANSDLDAERDVGTLLAEWKADQPALLKHFDLDGDGRIDLKEWQLARMQARREVERQHAEVRRQPGVDLVHAPRDGRYFLISNLDPNSLSRRYYLWTAFHLVVFLAGLVGAWVAVVRH